MDTPDLNLSTNQKDHSSGPGDSASSHLDGDSRHLCISSRLPGFYELSIGERLAVVSEVARLTDTERFHLGQFGSLYGELADVFIENAVGTISLPLGVATNFLINGSDILVPMAVEESSVFCPKIHAAIL